MSFATAKCRSQQPGLLTDPRVSVTRSRATHPGISPESLTQDVYDSTTANTNRLETGDRHLRFAPEPVPDLLAAGRCRVRRWSDLVHFLFLELA